MLSSKSSPKASPISRVKLFPSFFPTLRASLLAGVAVTGLLSASATAAAQAGDPAQTATPQTATPQTAPATADGTVTATPSQFRRGKKKVDSDTADNGKVVQSKDTKKAVKKSTKADALVGVDAKLPDKQLYDKAVVAMNKGHFDVARLDLQTMLNTYPDSQYQMRAKLAIADSWYKEGGTAALTQAESEYSDFRVFFPNAPEAAEAQMRIGDIYFRQMDKPDRDYSKALHAEEEYRRMLTDYPNAPPTLLTQAKQRLREVQEVMATRESQIANYYESKENWAAAIARYQTVADTYPLYSHMDDALIGMGDSYEAQARYWRNVKIAAGNAAGEAGRAKLEQLYDAKAADAYRRVVLEHYASAHVEDARDRLAAMNLPIPEPTKEQIAASVALENSRSSYTISNKLRLLVLHEPDVVLAAGSGDPSLSDPKPMVAPTVIKTAQTNMLAAFATAPAAAPAAAGVGTPAAAPAAAEASAPAPAAAPVAAAPLAFSDVPSSDAAPATPANLETTPVRPSSGVNSGTVGVEIVQPSSTPAAAVPATASAAAPPATASYGLKAVGPPSAAAAPAIERPSAAPDRPNEVTGATPAAQVVPAGTKRPKTAFDKSEESSSKHKKKKGLKKLDPLPQ